MRSLGLKPQQLIVLVVLALLDCLVIGVMGVTVVGSSRSVPAVAPPSNTQVALPTVASSPTRRPVPPTWTPRATAIAITAPQTEELYTFMPARCPFTIPHRAWVECGFINLPETRGDSPSGIVRLMVAHYRSYSDSPAADPVVFLTGGPGGAAVDDMASLYARFIDPLLAERDFIVFDQRGTGHSEPNLDCPEYTAAVEADLEQLFSSEEKAAAYPRALRRCRDRLVAQGINLAAYTSATNASDVKDIIQVLGYERASLYGASYGTRLAQTVMRDYANVVHSVVLDAVEPIEVPMYNGQAASVDRLLRRIFDGCTADADCRAAYPGLEDVYYDLITQLDASPVPVWTRSPGNKMYHVQLTGTWFTGAIFFGSYVTDMIAYMPRMIYDASAGDYELLEWMLGVAVSTEADLSIGMMLSVNCHEETFATTQEQLATDYASYPHIVGFANAGVYGAPETLFTICEEWGAAPFVEIEGQPVVSDIPALVLVGEYDPITPPAYAQQVAANLSRSYYYEFPGEGHVVGLWQNPCAASIVRSFFSDPTISPDAECLAWQDGPTFFR